MKKWSFLTDGVKMKFWQFEKIFQKSNFTSLERIRECGFMKSEKFRHGKLVTSGEIR